VRATASISTHPVAASATGEAVGQLLEAQVEHLNLVCCFVTSAHAGALEDIIAALHALLSPDVVLGAASSGVIGPGAVIDDGPGLVLWGAAVGPVTPLRLTPGAPDAIPDGSRGVVVLADPASAPAARVWLGQLPAGALSGALVSPARAAGGSVLALNGVIQRHGAVGVALGHGVGVQGVVCPGTRPVGPPMTVTRAEGPMIYELDGMAARARLDRMARDELPATDIAFINRGLALAVATETAEAVYPVAGADPTNGALGLGGDEADPRIAVELGSRVRFHVRDPAEEAAEVARALHVHPVDGALIFPSRHCIAARRGGAPLLDLPIGGCRAVAALGAAPGGTDGVRVPGVHRASAAVACFYDISSPSDGQQSTPA